MGQAWSVGMIQSSTDGCVARACDHVGNAVGDVLGGEDLGRS